MLVMPLVCCFNIWAFFSRFASFLFVLLVVTPPLWHCSRGEDGMVGKRGVLRQPWAGMVGAQPPNPR